MASWGDELAQWRTTAGLSRAQLSRLAHVSTKNIYNLEVRSQRPTVGTAAALTAALDRALQATPDAWSGVERRHFLCSATAVHDRSEPTGIMLTDVGRGDRRPEVSRPSEPEDVPAMTAESSPRSEPPGPIVDEPQGKAASTVPPDAAALTGRPRTGRRWWVVAAAVVVIGSVTVVAIGTWPWTSPQAASDSGVDGRPAPMAIGGDLSRPRWWVANDLTATRHLGTAVGFGRVGDVPVVGDHDGVPGDEIGLFRPSDGNQYWRSADGADDTVDAVHVDLARPGDWPLVGNWDGEDGDEIGFYRPAESVVVVGPDAANRLSVQLPGADVVPLVGDWNGDGRDDIGAFHRTDRIFDRHLLGGAVLPPVRFGESGDVPLVGDWDGDRVDEFAVYRPSTRSFRFADGAGIEIAHVIYGASDKPTIPVVGDWDGDGRDSQGVIQP